MESDHNSQSSCVRGVHACSDAPKTLLRARCPLCRTLVESRAACGPVELTCTSCGMRFSHDLILAERGQPAHDSRTADTLDRWLAGDPIRVSAPSDSRQRFQWCGRHRWIAVLAGMVASILLGAAVFGAVGYLTAATQLENVNHARQKSELQRINAERIAEKQLCLAVERKRDFEAASRQAAAHRAAREAAERQLRQTEQVRLQAEQQRLLAEQHRNDAAQEARAALATQLAENSRQLLGTHPMRSLFFAGESLRAKVQQGIAPDHSTEQVLRDALTAVGPPGLAGHDGPILKTALSLNGRWLATASADTTVRLWNLQDSEPAGDAIVLTGHRGPVTSLAISPDGRWLASAGFDGTAILWRLNAENPAESPIVIHTGSGRVHAMIISPNGRWLVTAGGIGGSGRCLAELWDLSAEDPAANSIALRGHERPILTAVVSSDSRWLATAGEDKTIRVWNLGSRHPAAEQAVLRGHEGWIGTLAISPDGRWLASGSYDATARLWRLDSLDPTVTPVVLRGHEGWVGTMAFSPNGRWLATGSFDRTIQLWEFRDDQIKPSSKVLTGHTGRIQALVFTPDNRRLISGSFDTTVRLWDIAAENPNLEPTILRGHQGPINSISVSTDGQWLVSGSGETFDSRDNTARVWDIGLDALLESAHLVALRHLTPHQREQMLLNAAQRDPDAHNPTEESPRDAPSENRLRIVVE